MTRLKILLLLGVVAVVSLVFYFIYSSRNTSKTASFDKSSMSEVSIEDVNSQEGVLPSSGKYVEYSPSVFSQNSQKRRVLFFYASWCPTCRPVDREFQESASQLPDDIVVIRINYNDSQTDSEEKELAEKYGITYQHTFVQIDEIGQVVTRWNGGGLDELMQNIQ